MEEKSHHPVPRMFVQIYPQTSPEPLLSLPRNASAWVPPSPRQNPKISPSSTNSSMVFLTCSHGGLLPGGLSEQAQYTSNEVSQKQLASVFNELENLVECVPKSGASMKAWVWEVLFN